MKVAIWPHFGGEDNGDGGVRRVVEAQAAGLPAFGWELAEAEDADVLASHITIPPQWIARYPRKPIVAFIHGLYWAEYEWSGSWHQKANADVLALTKMADIVTAPTEWVAQSIRRHTARDVRVVPHGVDAELWLPEPGLQHQGYVLWNKTRPDPVCDPTPMEELAQRMRETPFVSTFGRELPNVTLTGRRTYAEARDLVQRAGVYLATARETFGIGTLEAMAAGVPVVGWRWGGQAEFITHRKDGWLAEPGDLESLEAGVRWALANRAAVGAAAIATARRFSWARANEMYAATLAEAAERRVPTGPGGLKGGVWLSDRPRVSVIVTAYNLDRYLGAALDSVLAQSSDDWECIVVDDASPDECGAIADSFAERDSRFRVIHNETNLYLAGARNEGIAAARGEYIIPLDADDMLPPGALATLADALDSDRTIDIAYGGVEFIELDGRSWHSGWPVDFEHRYQLTRSEGAPRPNNLLPYASMFRREVWRLTGGYRERFRTAEDADFWCRASSYGFQPRKVTGLDCLIYRNRPDSMSRAITPADWLAWYPWAERPELGPAGACTETQGPVPSLDPPRVSIVIPCGPGHERLVMDAIDSVDAQTFRDWECIVVGRPETLGPFPSWVRVLDEDATCPCHDGDPCNYQSIPRSPASARTKLGVARARNVGVAAARALLFLPLDADDILQPEALELMLAAHEAGDGDIIYSDFYEDPEGDGTHRIWECPDYDAKLLLSRGAIHTVTALTPVAVWERVGGYDPALGWEDWGFQLECAAQGICSRRLRAPLLLYRKWTGRRREEIQAGFEAAKQSILAKYARFWDTPDGPAKEELMGCGSCGQRRTIDPQPRQSLTRAPVPRGAALLRYEGPKEGAQSFRGAETGTVYRFSRGEEKYVHEADLEHFMLIPGFVQLAGANMRARESDAPVLSGYVPEPPAREAEREPDPLPISTAGRAPNDPMLAALGVHQEQVATAQPEEIEDPNAIAVGPTGGSVEDIERAAIAAAQARRTAEATEEPSHV